MNYDEDQEDPWEEVSPEDDFGILHNGRPSIFRWEPKQYCDEPDSTAAKINAAEETRVRRKIQRDAIFFAVSIENQSRTKKSAEIGKEAARFVICKHDHQSRMAERLECSVSQFYRAVQWVKKHVGFHE